MLLRRSTWSNRAQFTLLFWIIASISDLSAQPVDNPVLVHRGNRQVGESGEDYSKFKGKIIRSISIQVREIFDEPNASSIYRAVNKLKINSREEIIGRELLFHQGQEFDPFHVEESLRILRELRFIREPLIVVRAEGEFVDIVVQVQDTWTLIPVLGYSSGVGRSRLSVGVAESNLLGYGKRLEALYLEEGNTSSLETVVEDPRIWGSEYSGLFAFFDRNDGQRVLASLGKPFRSFLDTDSWLVSIDSIDSVGRIFSGGDEVYIYRQNGTESTARYTFSAGNPEYELRRYTIGYDYTEERFSQADLKDYQDLELDPNRVSNDPALLAPDRRYSGPFIGIEKVVPDFISGAYIDRFDRVADYNLGERSSLSATISPEVLGSRRDTVLPSLVTGAGYHFEGTESFVIGELGFATRCDSEGVSDMITRVDTRYYNVLGPKYIGGYFVGKHTLAAQGVLLYGEQLNRDRIFYLGGDNGLRGYEARTFAGDKRFLLNLEDRIHLSEDILKLVSFGVAGFIDVGGSTYDSFGKLYGDEIYGDAGVGLRFAFPRSSGGSVLRVDLAMPWRDGPDGSNQMEVRIVFAGGQLFGSQLRSEGSGFEKANVGIGLDR